MIAKWLSWLLGRPPAVNRQVILYTRDGCHLCDEAWVVLQQVQRRYRLEIALVDVDSRPELAKEHGLHVPVIVIDGRVRFRGLVNRVLLRRILETTPEPELRGDPETSTQAGGGCSPS